MAGPQIMQQSSRAVVRDCRSLQTTTSFQIVQLNYITSKYLCISQTNWNKKKKNTFLIWILILGSWKIAFHVSQMQPSSGVSE